MLGLEHIHIVIPGAHGSELARGFALQLPHKRDVPPRMRILLQHWVLDGTIGVAPAHAERDVPGNLFGEGGHERLIQIGHFQVRPHGVVAAGDIEAHPRNRDAVVVGDYAADGLGVAQMTVGAENACRCALVA